MLKLISIYTRMQYTAYEYTVYKHSTCREQIKLFSELFSKLFGNPKDCLLE